MTQKHGRAKQYKAQERRSNATSEERHGNSGAQVRDAVDRMAEVSQQQAERFERAMGAFWDQAGENDYGPLMHDMLRANLELMGLMARSVKAYAELPSRLTRCRTPMDLLMSQQRLAADMTRDFYGTAARLLDASSRVAGDAVRSIAHSVNYGDGGPETMGVQLFDSHDASGMPERPSVEAGRVSAKRNVSRDETARSRAH